ncbi:MAG: twin-arginine translocase subunit TatB [Methylococcales symbiont of Iophon sp. n. MRB-2018]|nr:MAG: twin-arginine translocase subunit TatB [Methylococcales symbiont of Iophon sp. n. MRB-2018]KAF3980152.1 MAG: twin-arginine translocase subunit TatB [Methylococcales symbiont of Iophon sp. n. MRB-2018]
MFDVGFWELCLVGLVSLLVIGPEKLPKAARIAGFWLGKTRNMIASVKTEIDQELQAEEMRQLLKEQSATEKIKHLLEDGTEVANEIKASLKSLSEEQVIQSDESK